MTTNAAESRVDWLVTEFARTTHGVRAAVAVSADGLRLASSDDVDTGLADRLAAAASGMLSLARGTAHLLDAGAPAQTILEMTGGYVFVTPIGRGAVLTVHADRDCDIGSLGFEMEMLANRVGHVLEPSARAPREGGPR
jgi:uncharacterized protein